ncbi:hypothetical protein CONLIGDRAFT_649230 [Coniochaeta ligniaria NRRL 30616]|uniref:Uncharacterized protein n=1 Tax=Coniochaeta ligniaria NRRL 30616 TaxID=1408157 RepID=A0A1J7I8X3_9PEZI|nr:hypothetical protein CONLIGDRAFT_649230 [Coniochaeta ligniaria NRRL 30616]
MECMHDGLDTPELDVFRTKVPVPRQSFAPLLHIIPSHQQPYRILDSFLALSCPHRKSPGKPSHQQPYQILESFLALSCPHRKHSRQPQPSAAITVLESFLNLSCPHRKPSRQSQPASSRCCRLLVGVVARPQLRPDCEACDDENREAQDEKAHPHERVSPHVHVDEDCPRSLGGGFDFHEVGEDFLDDEVIEGDVEPDKGADGDWGSPPSAGSTHGGGGAADWSEDDGGVDGDNGDDDEDCDGVVRDERERAGDIAGRDDGDGQHYREPELHTTLCFPARSRVVSRQHVQQETHEEAAEDAAAADDHQKVEGGLGEGVGGVGGGDGVGGGVGGVDGVVGVDWGEHLCDEPKRY